MGYYVRVEPNVKIYVEDINPQRKKTILFIHGWPGSHKLFEYQFNQLPKMLSDFGDIFFFQHITKPFSDWFLQLGLQAAGWSTAAIANTWIDEVLFSDLAEISVPTLIIHGIHDKVVPFPLAEVQKRVIKDSKLIPFKFSGHGTFYDEHDKFNEELVKFIEG